MESSKKEPSPQINNPTNSLKKLTIRLSSKTIPFSRKIFQRILLILLLVLPVLYSPELSSADSCNVKYEVFDLSVPVNFADDSDSDGDGMTDEYELANGLNLTFDDSALDLDEDGLINYAEFLLGTSANNSDTDYDLMDDKFEVDYALNPFFDDSAVDLDSDGLTNLQEYISGTFPNDSDTDNDLMSDKFEVDFGLNPLVDDSSEDLDSDGLSNLQEYILGTFPNDSDTDNDLMGDKFEVDLGLNPLVDDSSADLDSDGLTNLEEFILGTFLNDSDTDDDLMGDKYESDFGLDPFSDDAALDLDSDDLTNLEEFLLGTNPNNSDTDNDLLPDNFEFINGLNPSNSSDAFDDLDDDGLSNIDEFNIGTLVNDPDTDNDQMLDGFEVFNALNPFVNDSSSDSDGDGLSNLYEFLLGLDPQVADKPEFDQIISSYSIPTSYAEKTSEIEITLFNPFDNAATFTVYIYGEDDVLSGNGSIIELSPNMSHTFSIFIRPQHASKHSFLLSVEVNQFYQLEQTISFEVKPSYLNPSFIQKIVTNTILVISTIASLLLLFFLIKRYIQNSQEIRRVENKLKKIIRQKGSFILSETFTELGITHSKLIDILNRSISSDRIEGYLIDDFFFSKEFVTSLRQELLEEMPIRLIDLIEVLEANEKIAIEFATLENWIITSDRLVITSSYVQEVVKQSFDDNYDIISTTVEAEKLKITKEQLINNLPFGHQMNDEIVTDGWLEFALTDRITSLLKRNEFISLDQLWEEFPISLTIFDDLIDKLIEEQQITAILIKGQLIHSTYLEEQISHIIEAEHVPDLDSIAELTKIESSVLIFHLRKRSEALELAREHNQALRAYRRLRSFTSDPHEQKRLNYSIAHLSFQITSKGGSRIAPIKQVKEVISETTIDIAPNSLPVGIASAKFSKTCVVCKGGVKENERFVSCPFCGEASHYSHMMEWVKIQSSCPNCKRKLKIDWWIE